MKIFAVRLGLMLSELRFQLLIRERSCVHVHEVLHIELLILLIEPVTFRQFLTSRNDLPLHIVDDIRKKFLLRAFPLTCLRKRPRGGVELVGECVGVEDVVLPGCSLSDRRSVRRVYSIFWVGSQWCDGLECARDGWR